MLYGWLPILLQVSLVSGHLDGHADRQFEGAALDTTETAPARPGRSQECPLFHGAICLCAAFAKLLPAAGAPARVAALAARGARRRFPAGRSPRPRPALLFDARGPPFFD
jgi:hypothetical protein